MPGKPVINLRYESIAQVMSFKKAAKLCRWSLNTFLLVAAERLTHEVLSKKTKEQAIDCIQRETLPEPDADAGL